MNINLCVQCDECSNKTNCRVGMSNRDFQPLKFSCRGCGSTIAIEFSGNALGLDALALASLIKGKAPTRTNLVHKMTHQVIGARELEIERGFDPKFDFVDLHLDFPVEFGKYVMGATPFMKAFMRAGAQKTEFHRVRLQLINENYKKYPQVVKLIEMYSKGHYGPFAEVARKRFQIHTRSNKLQDINAALYTLVSRYVLPFTLPDSSQEIVEFYGKTITELVQTKQTEVITFLQELVDTKFLRHLQSDCLKNYKGIFEAELPLRPALFLDLDSSYTQGITAMRVSSQEFEEYREVYKDMAEVLSRQLVLVAGINNLLKRGSHNQFASRKSKNSKELAPVSLNAYADVSLGNKPADLDDAWLKIDDAVLDNELRNAIAHNKIDYDPITQIVTYFPKLEGMERETERNIQLLDYMWRLLILFRQVHRLHHLIKCLNYATLLDPLAAQMKRKV